MKCFNKSLLVFLEDLEKNNSKEWFHENKKRYELEVKAPFKLFVDDLQATLQPFYPEIDLSDRTSIQRINRDVRFSKDKTPYKTQLGAMIMPGGKKNIMVPGCHIVVNANYGLRVYSGVQGLNKEQLYRLRVYLKDHNMEFNRLIHERGFSSYYGEIKGEKNKRIDKEFQPFLEEQPLILNKNFYWYTEIDRADFLNDRLIEMIRDAYEKTLPVNKWFEKVINLLII